MLDDNLPTFFLKSSARDPVLERELHHAYHGSDPKLAYLLRYPSPADRNQRATKNCYCVGLFDAYSPDVLYGEVMITPTWSQPNIHRDDSKRPGFIPPPPEMIVPPTFLVQLYNPDQQIQVELREAKWSGSHWYEFAVPMSTFRTPSTSQLDREQSDPTALGTTPKIHFAWRKESKLSRDLTCYMIGKSTDLDEGKRSRRSRKDPDITIALWRSMRELTIYEPNLTRVDTEDPKGLELILLLSAVVLKDVYYGSKDDLRAHFNLASPSNSSTAVPSLRSSASTNKLHSIQQSQNHAGPHPVADNPLAQWEIEVESKRLQAQVAHEKRLMEEAQERKRREKDHADEVERRRLVKIFEEEQRKQRRKEQEIENETQRLRKKYG